MKTYQTAEIAKIIGIHPNTVRLYEKLELIPKPEREANGYRIFTEMHLQQIKIIRLAFQVELVQNGLRKKIAHMVRTSALGDYEQAIVLAEEYLEQIRQEKSKAEEAVRIVRQVLAGEVQENTHVFRRKEVSEYLDISMDSIRNWEMNGLLTVRRKENGYRVYTDNDIRRLKIIRALKCANYSLAAILRMLNKLSENPDTNIEKVLNTPKADDDIIHASDKLIISLKKAEKNSQEILNILKKMKTYKKI